MISQGPGDDQNWGAKVASVPYFQETIDTFGKPFVPSVIRNEMATWEKSVLQGRATTEGQRLQGDQITVTATVHGWLRPSGGLWDRNQTVFVTSPMLIMNAEPLITKQVVIFSQDDATGTSTTLSCVIPRPSAG